MRKLILAAALALAVPLASCGLPPATLAVRDVPAQTVIAADAAYTAFATAGAAAVRAGQLDRAVFRARNEQAYAVLLKVRTGRASIEALYALTGN